MVAGKSGSFELTGTKGLSVRVFWSEEYSFDDNQSVVSINNIQITSSLDSGVTYYPTGKVTVDGQTVVEFNSFQGTHRVDLIKRGQYENIVANKGYPGSPWKTGIIDHDTDGTKSVTIALEFSCASINGGTGSGCAVSDSVSVELTAIPRASSITKVTDTVLGNICEVTWTPASASFYYRLKFIIGEWSHTTDIIHPNKTTEFAYRSYAIPLEVADQIPDSSTGEMAVELHTYSDENATVQVGASSEADFMVTVPENDLTRPTVTMALSPVSDLPEAFDGVYVQGKSKAQVDLSAEGKYGATIASYSMKAAARAYDVSGSFTSDYLSTPGETTITGYATDSRGFTGSVSKDITVLAYTKPKILPPAGESEVVVARCDAEGNLTSSGTYLKIKAKRSYSLLTHDGVQHNYCAIQFRYKLANAESYSEWVTILNGGSLASDEVETDALLGGVLSAKATYMVEIRAIDDVGEYGLTMIRIPTDTVYMHRTKNGMGLGKYVEGENLLDVAWDAHFRGEVRIGDTGMTLKEYILAVISEGG